MLRTCAMTSANRAHVVGLGLIGASLALALRDAGWIVTGDDLDRDVVEQALASGVITSDQLNPTTDLVAIATPARVVADVAHDYLGRLENPSLIVTDVAGVKGAIVRDVTEPRFL